MRGCPKEPFSHETAVKIIAEDRGVAFDPDITNVFLEIQPEFRELLDDFRQEG